MKEDQPTTNFLSASQLIKKTAETKRYVQLSNGYYMPITAKSIRDLADSMNFYQKKFIGEVFITKNCSYIEIY